jgi:hypothetical protein
MCRYHASRGIIFPCQRDALHCSEVGESSEWNEKKCEDIESCLIARCRVLATLLGIRACLYHCQLELGVRVQFETPMVLIEMRVNDSVV